LGVRTGWAEETTGWGGVGCSMESRAFHISGITQAHYGDTLLPTAVCERSRVNVLKNETSLSKHYMSLL